jgi:hypothetical protein
MWSEKDFLHDREEATPPREIQRREAGLARKKTADPEDCC